MIVNHDVCLEGKEGVIIFIFYYNNCMHHVYHHTLFSETTSRGLAENYMIAEHLMNYSVHGVNPSPPRFIKSLEIEDLIKTIPS